MLAPIREWVSTPMVLTHHDSSRNASCEILHEVYIRKLFSFKALQTRFVGRLVQ